MKFPIRSLLLAACILVVALAVGCGSKKTPATRSAGQTQSAAKSPSPAQSDKAAASPGENLSQAKTQAGATVVGVAAKPTASTVLKSLQKTYRSLRALKLKGVSTTIARADGKTIGQPQRSSISVIFKRPDRLVITSVTGQMTTDGKTVYNCNPAAKQYVKAKMTSAVIKSLVMSRTGIGTMGLLYGVKYDNAISSLKMLPDSKLGSREVYVISLQLKSGVAIQANVRGVETLWIGKKDMGLYRSQVALSYKPQPVKGAKGKTPKLIESIMTTDMTTFEPNPKVPDSAFAFKPPAGARLLEQPKPADISNKPAPDFPFTWTDGTTKKLSDFAGKFVLLDFWALPMCDRQLPVLQSVNAGLSFDTQLIAINVNANKASVQAYLKKNGYTFPVVYADQNIAKIATERYGLRGLPTMLILDKRGFVRTELLGIPTAKEIEAELSKIR